MNHSVKYHVEMIAKVKQYQTRDSLEILGFVSLDVQMDKCSEFDIGESFGQVYLTQKDEGA